MSPNNMGTLGVTLICVLVLDSLVRSSSSCFICCGCGHLSPNDPYYYINDSSNLICALNDLNQGSNSSDLYIMFNNDEVDPSFITVLNATAVSFNKVMRWEDDGIYYCYRRGFVDKNKTVGGQVVTVDYPIAPVKDLECIWYNWRDELRCTWSLPPYRYMHHIQVDLRLYNGAYIHCPNMVNKRGCTWKSGNTTLDTVTMGFQLNVTNTNPHKNNTIVGEWITKVSAENVKPHAVDYFHQEFTNLSSCLLVNWTYDMDIAKSRAKYFRIQYSPVTDPSNIKTVWSDKYNVTICDLTAYTWYKFTIAVHPDRAEVKGYWSDSVTQNIRTDQDVPGVAPELVGYRQPSELCIQNEKTTILWKSIPEVERNGLITNYSVTFTDLSPGGIVTEVIITNAQDTSVNHYLHCNKLYNVSISAATVKGYSPHHSSLTINTAGMTPTAVMVERNDSLYDVSWTVPRPVDSLTSFSVVYCTTIGSQQDCSGELQKVYVPHSRTRHQTLSLKSDTTYLFGVSMTRTGVTSAAKFESCIYVVTETPNSPVFSVDATIGENRLRVEWDPIACNNKQPYVRNFTITWCRTNNKLEDQCIGKEESVVITSTSKRDHIISNLEKDVRYGVTMLSSSSSQTSLRSETQYGTATNSDLLAGEIAGIVIGCVFLGVLAIAGLVLACRCLKQRVKKATKPYEIETPELEEKPSLADSSDSEEALLHDRPPQRFMDVNGHTNINFQHQISQDSGVGSQVTEPESPERLKPVLEDEYYFKVQEEGESEGRHSCEVQIPPKIKVGFVIDDNQVTCVPKVFTQSVSPSQESSAPEDYSKIFPEARPTSVSSTLEQEYQRSPYVHTTDVGLPSPAPYVDSTAVGLPSTAPYIDSTTVGLPSNTSYVDSTAVGLPSTAPYVDSTAVGLPSNTSYVDSTAVGLPSTAPTVDSTDVGLPSTAPYVDSTAVGLPSPAPYVDSNAVGLPSTAPYVDSTAVGLPSTAPYVHTTDVGHPLPASYEESTVTARPLSSPTSSSETAGLPLLCVENTFGMNINNTSPTPHLDPGYIVSTDISQGQRL